MRISRRSAAGLFIVAGSLISPAHSQNPDNTSAQASQASESTSLPAASPSATISVEPPSLIPPNILPGPGAGSLPQLPASPDLQILNQLFKESSLGKAADEARLHQQMSRLQTRLRNDAELHAARGRADLMPTDLEKRHMLKAYYELYYRKLRALATAPDVQAYIDAQKNAHLLVLLQPKTRHETDEPEATRLASGAAPGTKALPTPIQARAEQMTVRPR